MKVEVLGTGCPKCKELERLVNEVINELGVKAEVVKVTDIAEIISHGVMSTPALFVNDKEVCSGRLPSKEELKKAIK